MITKPDIHAALDSAAEQTTPAEYLRALKSLERTYAALLKSDPNARERFLADLGFALQEAGDWAGVLRVARRRVKLPRPVTRTTHQFVFLVAAYVEASRRMVRPVPYLREVLDEIPFIEDIGVEPSAVIALQQMVRLPDYKLCGKAIYIFKKASRRYGEPGLPFTKASVDKLAAVYRNNIFNRSHERR